jgi:enamine deaminase RidA (YjgF/YER057c/UK114 family)
MGDVIDGRLRELGYELAAPKAPVANYLGTKRSGDLLFVSGRVSRTRGEVGTDLSTDSAREAARDTMLDLLSIIKNDIGRLSKITSGDAGRHARTATGVAQLPFGAAVQLELVVRLGSDA